MREEITIVYCDKCNCQVEIQSTIEDTVSYRIEAMGWTVTGEEDYCPECSDELEDADEMEDND